MKTLLTYFWKQNFINLLVVLLMFFSEGVAFGQCSNFNSNYPSGTHSTTSTTYVTVSSSISAGEYADYSVTNGYTYYWTTCGDTDFDTQLTLVSTDQSTGYAYNDDDCGSQSTVSWEASFTGTVRLLVSKYDCQTVATTPYTTVQWKCSEPPTDSESDIIRYASFSEPTNISYTTYSAASSLTTSNSIKVGEFTIRDGGSDNTDSDESVTTLTDITFTITNSANITALAIFDGTTNLKEVTSVTGTTVFATISGLTAADEGTKNFALYATFKTTVTDNQQMQFTVSSATATGGSTFATADAGAAATSISGDANRIEVVATKLDFTTEPSSTVCANTNLVTPPTVTARDVNNNTDLDFTNTIAITNAGSLAMSSASLSATAGVSTFTNLQFTAGGNAGILTASYTGLTNATSSTSVTVNTIPSAPISTAGSNASCDKITANWNASTGATKYYIDIDDTDNNFGSLVTDDLDVGNVTTYEKTGLTQGITYYYRVRAENSCGISGNSNAISYAASEVVAPTCANTSVCDGSTKSLTATGSTGNYRWYDASSGGTLLSSVAGYTTPALSSPTSYYVEANDGSGSETEIFNEDFETGAAWSYSESISSVNDWYVDNTSCNISGNYSLQVHNTSDCQYTIDDQSANTIAYKSFSSLGYTNLLIDFKWTSGGESSYDYLMLVYSTDGTNWFDVSSTKYNLQSSTQNEIDLALPSAMENQSTIYIGFRWINDGSLGTNNGAIVDDIVISGTTEPTCKSTRTQVTVSINPNPETPTVQAESLINSLQFTANWNAGTDDDGYHLIVDDDSDFSSPIAGYNNLDVGNVTSKVVTGLSPSTTYYYKVRGYNSNCGNSSYSSSESATTTASDSESDIIRYASFSEPTNISYTTYSAASSLTTSNSIKVGEFTIRDGGSDNTDSDESVTTLTDITFTITNSANITALAIFDGTTNLKEVTSVTGTTVFATISGLTAADEGTKNFALYATFKTTVTDNQQMQFTVSSATATGGSTFATADAGAATTLVSGDENRIEVVATKLVFDASKPASIVPLNDLFSVTVMAYDINDNLDVDDVSSITLVKNTGSGTLAANATPTLTQNLIGGTYDWTNIYYNVAEACFKIEAQSGSLTNAVSNCIECLDVPGNFNMTAPLTTSSCAGNITVTWSVPSGTVDSYDLYFCTGGDCNSSNSPNTVVGITSPYTFDASSYDNDTVRFQIKANNSAGQTWSTNTAQVFIFEGNSWSGTVSSDWANASNWCGGLPDFSTDIIIPAGADNFPTLTANATLRNLTIESGASFNLGSYTINVYGDWENNGILTGGTGTANFTGTATQTVDNGDQAFNNFTVNKASGTISVENNTLDVDGNLLISSGTLDANNLDIEVQGNWTDNANFTTGTGTVIFDGTGISEIYRTGTSTEIYSEGFENGNSGWIMQSIEGNTEFRIQTGSSKTGSYACGTYDLDGSFANDYCYYADCGYYGIDFMRSIDLSLYSDATLTYWYIIGASGGGRGILLIDGESEFEDQSKTSFTERIQPLGSLCGNGKHQLAFRFYQGEGATCTSPGFIIDDISIVAIPNFETFNSLLINKTSGGSVKLKTSIVSINDLEISTGSLTVETSSLIYFYGDFINNGTFNHGDSKVEFKSPTTQYIKGSSNSIFYEFGKNSAGELIIGDASSTISVEVENDFLWTANNDKITVGDGMPTTFTINDGLYIKQGCELVSNNTSTISVYGNYTNYGNYTPHDGTINFFGGINTVIIKEPATVIYSQDFENGTPSDWTLEASSSNSEWRVQSGFGYLSDNDLAIYDLSFGYMHGYNWPDAVSFSIDASKDIDLSGYENVRLSFYYRIGGNTDDYGQVIVKEGASETILLDNLKSEQMWKESGDINISQYANQTITIVFRFISSNTGGLDPGFCIDDVKISTTSDELEILNNLIVNKTLSKSAILWCPIDVNGNVLISNGDFNSGGNNFPVAGNWTNNTSNSTTFTHENNTVTFDGTGTQTIDIGTTSFYNVTVNKVSGTASLKDNTLDIDNDLILTAGTLNAYNQDIEIDGDWINNGATFTHGSQIVNFLGTGDQQIKSNTQAFYDIVMNKSSSLTLIDNIDINGTLTLTAGTFDPTTSNRSINVAGDWLSNGGSFNKRACMVTFDGTATQEVNKKVDGSVYMNDFSFYNVTIDGNDVQIFYDSDTYLMIINNLIINSGKVVKVIDQ